MPRSDAVAFPYYCNAKGVRVSLVSPAFGFASLLLMGGEIASLVRPVRPPCVLPERKNIAAGGGLKKISVF